MANITELQLQGDSTVHKLNDARITTTAVSTATHFLATDSSISSIAPITAANLASVLGVVNHGRNEISDLNSLFIKGIHLCEFWDISEVANLPNDCNGWGICVSLLVLGIGFQFASDYKNHLWFRTKDGDNLKSWVQLV